MPIETTDEIQLKRAIGLPGAVIMGLGSVLGTGVFVSIGIGAGVAGAGVLLAIVLAALLATCNGLSSAQLAANHPVSGGTYEYGYRWLSPSLGFIAGWTFLTAKAASAATAALGFSGYLRQLVGHNTDTWLLPLGMGAIVLVTFVALAGIRCSNFVNIGIVSVTIIALGFFVSMGVPAATKNAGTNLQPLFDADLSTDLLQATALLFVAYTGYGRIATLGEEVDQPRRTIPRAVILTLVVSMTLYLAVAFVGLGVVGAEGYAKAAHDDIAPLAIIGKEFGGKTMSTVMVIGAATAMLSVLLNLVLGLSRVLLAMGRRRDMPVAMATVDGKNHVPRTATLVAFAVICGFMLLGDVSVIWSFSAFNVLIYYALTNLCALQLTREQRLFPIWPAYAGLAACLFLAFWVDWQTWLAGLGLITFGLAWRKLVSRALPSVG